MINDIILYVVISIGLMSIIGVIVYFYPALLVVLLLVAMYIPAISAYIADRLYLKKGLKNYGVKLDGIKIPYVLLALVYPLVVVLLGGIIASICGLNVDWHLTEFTSSIAQLSEETGIPYSVLWSLVLTQLIIAPFLNAVFAFGEEVGWRGYLLDRLRDEYGLFAAVIVSGVIWGVWHWPIILAVGYNYTPETRFIGIFLFVAFTVFVGVFLSWLKIKTNSVLYPALAHGAVNAYIGMGIFLVRADRVIGFPAGIISIAATLLVATPIFWVLTKNKDGI